MSVQYSEDGTILLSAELNPGETEIAIADGCRIVSRKAFMYQDKLVKVAFPESLERIEDFAFACTSLTEIKLPSAVTHIGTKAFYQCKKLKRIYLNEGLQNVGSESFAQTGLEELYVPSTVRHLGLGFVYNTPISLSENSQGLSISPDNSYYHRDAMGGIYRATRGGLLFSEMVSQVIEVHEVERGTFAIARGAYMRCDRLQSATLPGGVKVLGKRAFDRVITLECVDLPQSLEYIGDCAFRKTSLKKLVIPKSLKFIGESALMTGMKGENTIERILVDPHSAFFFTENNFLIQRPPSGAGHGIAYFGTGERIVIPRSIQTIGAYCIACTQPIRALVLHGGLTRIHPLAVAPHCRVEEVIVEHNRLFCGSKSATIPFLDKRTFYSPTYSLFPTGNVNVHYLFSQSDQITYLSHRTYLRARTMLNRLACPQYLSDKYESLFREALTRKIFEVCIEFSSHEYLEGFERLREFGFINQTNITEIIERVRSSENVVVTSYLLEMRKGHFLGNNLQEDFSL